MVCQVDGRCSCSGDNERANERGKDVFERQVQAVGSPKSSTKSQNDEQSEEVDREWCTLQRGLGRRQL